jgi:hypothetical protein
MTTIPSERGLTGTGGPPIGIDGAPPGGNGEVIIPKTCAEAANARTYVGCEFWPTVVETRRGS